MDHAALRSARKVRGSNHSAAAHQVPPLVLNQSLTLVISLVRDLQSGLINNSGSRAGARRSGADTAL